MNDRAIKQVAADSQGSVATLQRSCACGNHTIGGPQCAGCWGKSEKKLQRKGTGGDGPSNIAPPIVHDVLNSPGQSLDLKTRSFFEPRFGHDFSNVRVHNDAKAAESASAVDALAYTVGKNLVFNTGGYRPHDPAGMRLLAHELTHVVQQSNASPGVQRKIAIGDPDSKAEREADNVANDVLSGRLASIAAPWTGGMQRQTAPGTGAPNTGQPQAAPTPRRPERESLDPAGHPGKPVRAEVYRSPTGGAAVLTVTLRCSVVFAERPLGSNPGRPIELPTAAQQATWRQNFTERISRAWSFKHYLDLDGPCPGERERAVVNFQAIDRGSPDVTIYVYSWTPTGWRSFVRGNEMHLDIGDVDANFGSGQVVAAHETGHSLGLSHIGCDTNDFWCYGMFNDAADIMGGGPTVSARDYQTFADIMGQVTNCRWKVTQASAPAHNYLPLAVGFGAGVLGAVLGGMIGFVAGGPVGAFLGAAIGGLGFGFGMGALVGATGGTAS